MCTYIQCFGSNCSQKPFSRSLGQDFLNAYLFYLNIKISFARVLSARSRINKAHVKGEGYLKTNGLLESASCCGTRIV